MDYVLDACALIAFLNDEPEADTVADLLKKVEDGVDRLYINSIQVLEIYYDRIYIIGREYADIFLESLYASPLIILPEISNDIIREAGRVKTSYSISLADSIAAATTINLGAVLVTKDDEIKKLEDAGEFSILWLN